MARWSKGLTVASVRDLGEVCHLGVCLLHAITVTPPTGSRMHHIVSFSTLHTSVYFTPLYGCKPFGSYPHLVISNKGLLVRFESYTILHRQVPNYTLSYGAAMILLQSTVFCALLKISNPDMLETPISTNARDPAPSDLQQ